MLDPYFSATKIAWILDNVEGARQKANEGKLKFGTADSFLIWRLTQGKVHATDASNASRTLLYNIHEHQWDDDLLKLFNIPRSVLPEVKNSIDNFGLASNQIIGQSIPILGVAGDQQAATIGQLCLDKGMVKSTYGTGCFMLMNTGDKVIQSKHRFLSTIAWQINKKVTYALEGSIFNAGTAIQWLRDEMQFIDSAQQTESIAKNLRSSHGILMVPAFTGLGAPYWDSQARGAILGITRNTTREHIVRAALESVCYQTHDLLTIIQQDSGITASRMRVDGGMSNNDWLMQFLADILTITIERPKVTETTACGAALLAAVGAGMFSSLHQAQQFWQLDLRFIPKSQGNRNSLIQKWSQAINQVRSVSSKETLASHSLPSDESNSIYKASNPHELKQRITNWIKSVK